MSAMHSLMARVGPVSGSVSRLPVLNTRGSGSLGVQLSTVSCYKTRRPAIKEIQCPPVIKHSIESLSFPGAKVSSKTVSVMQQRFLHAQKMDRDVRQFSQELREAFQDFYTPFCIRGGPVNDADSNHVANSLFAEIVSQVLGLEVTGAVFLKGRDASVEAFHADTGLQDLTRFKDGLMMSCVKDPIGIPFEVLPWPVLKRRFSEEETAELKQRSIRIESDVLKFEVNLLDVDDAGREQLFVDSCLILDSAPVTQKMVDVIQEEQKNALVFRLDPGDCVYLNNFSGLHRRAESIERDGYVVSFTQSEYWEREMIRFDFIDPKSKGRHV